MPLLLAFWKCSQYTGSLYKAIPRFGEFWSCCCLPLLPQIACSIPATWKQPYIDSLYAKLGQ